LGETLCPIIKNAPAKPAAATGRPIEVDIADVYAFPQALPGRGDVTDFATLNA
jgi:hypothetical protein